MLRSCMHTHNRICDGVGEPREYAERALALGFRSLGFSSHAPLPYPNPWSMRQEDLPVYLSEIRGLKRNYLGRLEIAVGLEIDYLPPLSTPRRPAFPVDELDYRIGSVHCLGRSVDGEYREVDGPQEMFDRLVAVDFGGSARGLVERYFERVGELATDGGIDILAHLDLPKKNNPGDRHFREDEAWYRSAVLSIIPVLAASGVIVEINTGGLTRGRTSSVYPSLWILRLLREAGVPTMINADAHHPEHIDSHYDLAETLAREAGYAAVRLWMDGAFHEVELGHG